jgi:4-amino-4-deoxy-L-arabinose transferase-like glycosyltransferase
MTFTTDTASEPDARNIGWPILGLLIFLISALFLSLRLRWVGHLLVWDEAMDVCSIRALVSGGSDDFSHWFWRHPPLFACLTMLLQPLKAGFAERIEILNIAIGALNTVLLFLLNKRVLGRKIALLSVLFLAVMPGSAFFDVWIKRDLLVTTFGLSALLLLFNRRIALSALALGLALLSKENAVFYMAAALIAWGLGAAGTRRIRDLLVLTAIPALACGWWYLWIAPGEPLSSEAINDHFTFAMGRGWIRPLRFYPVLLIDLLGSAGSLLTGAGFFALFYLALKRRLPGENVMPALWPVLLLVPSLLFLSLLKAKVPWMMIIFLPALATLQAAAVSGIAAGMGSSPRVLAVLASAGALAVFLPFLPLDYESMLMKVERGQWRGATYSRQAADAVNNLVSSSDRMLLSSFHYWKDIDPRHPCPIFTCYLKVHPAVLICPAETSFEEIVNLIISSEIQWALLSPPPGPVADDIFRGAAQQCALPVANLRKTLLIQTSALLKESIEADPLPKP